MTQSSKSVDKDKDKDAAVQAPTEQPEPLPIWFFVGLILLVYGVLVVLAGFIYTDATTVLASTRPALWWGAVITVAGGVFLAIGIRVHRATSSKVSKS
jgi:hypothetical protein